MWRSPVFRQQVLQRKERGGHCIVLPPSLPRSAYEGVRLPDMSMLPVKHGLRARTPVYSICTEDCIMTR